MLSLLKGIFCGRENVSSRTMQAAKTLCEISGWSLTNLKIHKMLYIANRVFYGRHGRQLVDSSFEAWDYGPVLPDVYQECKMYGSKPVREAFLLSRSFGDGEEMDMLREAYSILKSKTGGQLVSMTHSDNGAWARVYRPGIRGIVIPDEFIKEEYDAIKSRN